MQATIQAIKDVFSDFQNRVNGYPFLGLPGYKMDVLPLLEEFMEAWILRVGYFARCWVTNHIAPLEATWKTVIATTTDQGMRGQAQVILDQIGEIAAEAGSNGLGAPSLAYNLGGTCPPATNPA
jgi:hypothetical protein